MKKLEEIKMKEEDEIQKLKNYKLDINPNPKILNKPWVKATLNSSYNNGTKYLIKNKIDRKINNSNPNKKLNKSMSEEKNLNELNDKKI